MMNGIDLSSQFSSFFTNTILDSFAIIPKQIDKDL
ncbi:hypothetical protein SAMN04487762_1256 [Polaribacter sp. Hel1_33_78]|nr:hypothetical protein SAMN04487762_1256 [Polaribacter sp. Hel1_33_78]